MSMCRKSGAPMNAIAAATIFLLVLVGCHAFSAHGIDDVEVSGGGHRELDERSNIEGNVAGLCIDSPCDADPNRTCFCCTRLANEPCYDTPKQCVSACPNCNFLVCPPPPAPRPTRRLGSPPASTA